MNSYSKIGSGAHEKALALVRYSRRADPGRGEQRTEPQEPRQLFVVLANRKSLERKPENGEQVLGEWDREMCQKLRLRG